MVAQNLALATNGARVIAASSWDSRLPPENLIDGKMNTFWSTTGMYPQDFIIELQEKCKVESISIQCYNVREMQLESSSENDPIKFVEVVQMEFEFKPNTLQKQSVRVDPCEGKYLKFTIVAGYDHFVFVNNIVVNGMPA